MILLILPFQIFFQDRPVPLDATPLDIIDSLKPYHTLQFDKWVARSHET